MTNFTSSLQIDFHLLDNRYVLELQAIVAAKPKAYEYRSACIALDRKYDTVREALKGLYDLGIQHTCNLSELLDNFHVVVGQTVK